jgi:hypothetical protein
MDLMAGDIEYGEYAHFILSKICKAILKRAVLRSSHSSMRKIIRKKL